MRLSVLLLALLLAAPALASDHLSPTQTMRMAAVRGYNPNGPAMIGGGGHAFGPANASVATASYVTAPGVGIYQNMLSRTTPPVSGPGGTTGTAGSAISSGAASITIVGGSCPTVAAGQQVIDASAGVLVGTVGSTPCSGTGTITVYFNPTSVAAAAVSHNIVVQNTLPDACQGTITERIKGNFSLNMYPTVQASNGFINGNGKSGNFYEQALGLYWDFDPALRFNWHNASNYTNQSKIPYLNVGAPNSDKWLNVLATWNSCTGANYAVAYYAYTGGAWARVQYQFENASAFSAFTSNPFQGINNNAFSFASDGSSTDYAFMGATEDDILDMGSAGSNAAVGFATGDASCGAYNDGNPCVPTAVLNAFYDPTAQKAVRINSTGNCSDLFAAAGHSHQPAFCLTTDGGGAYNPSPSNFIVNQGYGGSMTLSGAAATYGTPGPAEYPVSGPAGAYEKWIIINPSSTGAGTYAPLGGALSPHVITAGDFLVVTAAQASVTTITCSTGWTRLWSGTDMGNNATPLMTTAICWRVATGDSGDATAVITTADTSTNLNTIVADYGGVDVTSAGANAIDAFATFQGTYAQTTQPFPNVLTSYANDLYVGVIVNAGNNYFSFQPPTGLGVRAAATAAGSSNAKIAVLDGTVPSPGVTTFGAASAYYSSQQTIIGFALKASGATFAPQAHLAAYNPAGASVAGDFSGAFHVPASQSIATAACWGSGAAGVGASSTNSPGGSGGGYASVSGVSAPASGIVYWRQAGFQQGNAGVVAQQTASSFINLAGSNSIPASSSQGCNATTALAGTTTASGTPGCGSGNACIGTTTFLGGVGGTGGASHAGGGGAGSTANGTAGSGTTGGAGGSAGGGAGGNFVSNAGTSGLQAGGGGGGSVSGNWGGWGGSGKTVLSW